MILVSTARGFVVSAQATLLGEDTGRLQAWAERHVRRDPDLRWIVGNYVEANNANSNGHTFPLSELVEAQHTIPGKPLNMLHREKHIVGYFAGAQLLGPSGDELSAELAAAYDNTEHPDVVDQPYVEALAGLWYTRFPDEYFDIQRAHKEGTLFFSMEAIPEEVSCPSCSTKAAFTGFESDDYCEHMQGITGPKVLHRPVFSGGAIIVPPVRPGWNRADVKTISHLLEREEAVRADIASEFPHLGAPEWEWMMAQVLSLADTAAGRDFSTKDRKDLADKGKAMPGGGFPIKSRQDVKNAIQAIGRAKNPAAAKAHIRKMAKKLGCEDLIPAGW